MLGGIIFAAALVAGSGDLSNGSLDGAGLRQAITANQSGSAAPSVGRKFRVVIPFADGRKVNMQTLQSPAHWTYNAQSKVLKLVVGLGEISRANYSAFDSQNLGALPPLQTLVFSTDESRRTVVVQDMVEQPSPQVGYTRAQRATVSSFGLLAVDDAGARGLPEGFRPLMIQEIRLPSSDLRPTVNGLSLIVEGETVDLNGGSTVLCGDYNGNVGTHEINNAQTVMIEAHQCFVTVRITRALVADGHRNILASWPR